MPCAASASFKPISSVARDLTLITSRALCPAAIPPTIALHSAASRAQCTCPPARVTDASNSSSCSGIVAIARALIPAPASRKASQSGTSATLAARLARIVLVALPTLRRIWVSASSLRAAAENLSCSRGRQDLGQVHDPHPSP